MADTKNRRWLLAERPTGPIEDKYFKWVEEAVPEIKDGEILVRVLYLSCDPTQRGWLTRDTYMPAVKIGEVVRSGGVGRVIASKNSAFSVGDLVGGLVGWQDYAVLSTRRNVPAEQNSSQRSHPACDEHLRFDGPHRVFWIARSGATERR